MDPVTAIILCAALGVATFTDISRQRIPNLLTFPLILAGPAYFGLTTGTDGLLFSLGGLGVGLGLMLAPYLLGVMGAGDVKLMAGVGAWLGAGDALSAFLYSCVAGGIYAFIMLAARRGATRSVFASIRETLTILAVTGRFHYVPAEVGGRPLPKLCYGAAIAAGTVLSLAHSAWIARAAG